MLLAEFLPSRSHDDIVAERVRLWLGGEVFDLPALPLDAEEKWRAECAADFAAIYAAIDAGDSASAVAGRLLGLVPVQLRLIRKYDQSNLLPPDEWIRERCSGSGVLKAFVEVFAAANPQFGVLMDAAVRHPEMLWELLKLLRDSPSPPSSNGQPPSTAGPLATSGTR